MIRLFIAEDQRMLLSALGSLLDLEEDMEQATNGEEALTAILKLEPDVCLMDIEMPVKSGLEVAEEPRKARRKNENHHPNDVCASRLLRTRRQKQCPRLPAQGRGNRRSRRRHPKMHGRQKNL